MEWRQSFWEFEKWGGSGEGDPVTSKLASHKLYRSSQPTLWNGPPRDGLSFTDAPWRHDSVSLIDGDELVVSAEILGQVFEGVFFLDLDIEYMEVEVKTEKGSGQKHTTGYYTYSCRFQHEKNMSRGKLHSWVQGKTRHFNVHHTRHNMCLFQPERAERKTTRSSKAWSSLQLFFRKDGVHYSTLPRIALWQVRESRHAHPTRYINTSKVQRQQDTTPTKYINKVHSSINS